MFAFAPATYPTTTADHRRGSTRPELRLVSNGGRPASPARVPPSTYRRRQALAAGLVATAIAVASTVLGALGDGSRSVPEYPVVDRSAATVQAGRPYLVQEGDTFWSLARALRPGQDPRPLMERLVAEHGGPILKVGEELWVTSV